MSVKNTPFGGSQVEYHANYRNTPRERDKVGLSILNKIRKKIDGKVEIVDIGAGAGTKHEINLRLTHLYPALS